MVWLLGPRILIFDGHFETFCFTKYMAGTRWEGNLVTGSLGTLIEYPWSSVTVH